MWALIVFGVLTLLLLVSCSAYHRQYPTTDLTDPDNTSKIERYVVQVDDFGTFWSAPQAQSVLDRVEAMSKTENIHVVLFIHGWHHTAKESDPNLTDFTGNLKRISERLNHPVYAGMRTEYSGRGGVRVIGIYAGWRGRALPWLFDYFTLWWRKAAAERVGDGDMGEFILRLQRIYLRANASSRTNSAAPGPNPMMGLVSLGHSLGGQVLLRSIAEGIEHDLALRATRLSDPISPAPVEPTAAVRSDIDSFGDLNILVNPAIEAYQFARIDALAHQLTYPADQQPQLIVFSSDNDVPRSAFFPIARMLTRPFRPGFRSGTEQGALWGKTLGEYKPQQSHDLRVPRQKAADTFTEQDYETEEGRRKIREWDFTSETTFKQVSMIPRPGANRRENSPTAVVYTHDGLIKDHNDLFGKEFWAFLLDYVSFVEGKRLLWRLEPAQR